jgi:hypothetical protein
MLERRASPRRRTLKGALVAGSADRPDVSCTLRDISETGARLSVPEGVIVPGRFELLVVIDGMQAACEVVRRDRNEVGVRFLAKPRFGAPLRRQVLTAGLAGGKPSLRRKPIAA